MDSVNIEWMKVSDLSFDLKNPRLPEFDLPNDSTEVDVIRVLWEAMDVRELVMSISASGFFRHEPLIVVQEDGKNVVIEGNRRPAAAPVTTDITPVPVEADRSTRTRSGWGVFLVIPAPVVVVLLPKMPARGEP